MTIRWLTALAVLCLGVPVRAAGDKAAAIEENYSKPIDNAVNRGLAFLAKSQDQDGSFAGGPGGEYRKNTAVASLCVMAFLARGYTPGHQPYGDVINKGVDFVLSKQDKDGTIIGEGGGTLYSHHISTLMLSEVTGMVDPVRQKKVDAALSNALRVIVMAQKVPKKDPKFAGGWRYGLDANDSDMSHCGWALMALRSARSNGAPVPAESIDEAVKFITRCSLESGGFTYQASGPPGLARTGAAILCLELCHAHRDELTLRSGSYLLKKYREGWNSKEWFYYGNYYCAQGMFQLGGEQWEEFAPLLYDTLLKIQNPAGDWPHVDGKKDEKKVGAPYRTALAVLALSVSYRQLPIYQR